MRLDAEDKQFQLQLAIISGQASKKSSIEQLSRQLKQASSDILEDQPVSDTKKLNKVLGG